MEVSTFTCEEDGFLEGKMQINPSCWDKVFEEVDRIYKIWYEE